MKTTKAAGAAPRGVGSQRHPVDFPVEEDILACAPEGWTHYIRQLGTDFITQVSIYNEVLGYFDELSFQSNTIEAPGLQIGHNRIDWQPGPRVLLLENTALGVCWMFWVIDDWEPTDPPKSGFPGRHRLLQLSDVRACIKVMSPAAYAEHLEWEMARAKH